MMMRVWLMANGINHLPSAINHEHALYTTRLPLITRTRNSTMAITSNTWMNPAIW